MKMILVLLLPLFSMGQIERKDWKPEDIITGTYLTSHNVGVGYSLDMIGHTLTKVWRENSDGTVVLRPQDNFFLISMSSHGFVPKLYPTKDSLCSYMNAKYHTGYRLATKEEIERFVKKL